MSMEENVGDIDFVFIYSIMFFFFSFLSIFHLFFLL